MNFKLVSKYKPTGDQPKAINNLVQGIKNNQKHQVLVGVTGSGKTFTIANVIEKVQKPTLIISHNKTLAAQLYQEFKEFFPQNSVQYFVSYYDYYQPEAYIPQRDLYIEKDADINEEIDKLRLAATSALMTRSDVIIVASVSCIYNLGSPKEYKNLTEIFSLNKECSLQSIQARVIELLYDRNETDFTRGTFRIRGNNIDIYPSYEDFSIRIELINNKISNIQAFNPISGEILEDSIESYILYPSKHYVFDYSKISEPIAKIKEDLDKRVKILQNQNKELEAHRLKQKVLYDIDMIREVGYCKGIENYSIYFDDRMPGDPPYTLLDYFPKDYLLIIDESHITIPQIGGMYHGDESRKKTLIDYGFRLPSALDNRPLRFDEFKKKQGTTIYMSATPDNYELNVSGPTNISEQLIRPTGLVDPEIEVRNATDQVKNLVEEIKKRISNKERVLVTTLTKKMAEELSTYLSELEIKVTYLHSDIKTLERTDILNDLRTGTYDVLVGINLLREGLDLPEVALVAILDADKEGFLRSKTSLIQTMGRAARNINGKVILYADKITKSMNEAINEVTRRREIQLEYNRKNNITPQSIQKELRERILPKNETEIKNDSVIIKDISVFAATYKLASKKEKSKIIKSLRLEMKREAEMLNFERAIKIRDMIKELLKK